MLLKEKKEEEKIIYDWPKSYYMEADPKNRREVLNHQLSLDDSEQLQRIADLFECRYQKRKDGQYIDLFMQGWLEMSVIRNDLRSPFAKRRIRKLAGEIVKKLCLDREDLFGREVLFDELGHLAGVYITSCMSDSHYQSILLGIGRMKEEKLIRKINHELDMISKTIPDALEMKEDFSLLTEAVSDMRERLL